MNKENIKIITSANYWVCENMDLLAPINEDGIEYLLSNNTRIRINENDTTSENALYIASLKRANEEEKKQFAREQYGYIFRGDKVVITRGRKMLNEEKIVNGYYRFVASETYGKVYTDYVFFTDGTKVNINYCDTMFTNAKTNNRYYAKDLSEVVFNVGGQQ